MERPKPSKHQMDLQKQPCELTFTWMEDRMRIAIAAAALLASNAAYAAEGCAFMHETDPEQWVTFTDDGFVWHKDGEKHVFLNGYVDEKTSLRGAGTPEGVDPAQDAWYRIATIDGRKTLIFDTQFYYEDCAVAAK